MNANLDLELIYLFADEPKNLVIDTVVFIDLNRSSTRMKSPSSPPKIYCITLQYMCNVAILVSFIHMRLNTVFC